MLQSFQRKYLEIISFISPYFLELIEAIIYDLSELIRLYLKYYIKYDLPKLISSFSSYFLNLINYIKDDLPKLIISYFVDLIDYIKSHLPELKEFIISYSFKKFIYFFKI